MTHWSRSKFSLQNASGHNYIIYNVVKCDLATAIKIARAMAEDSRKYNRKRLARKANEQQISPGDSVVIRAEGRVSLTSLWDPEWIVKRVKRPVVFLHHQRSGKTKVLNKEKVRIVNPEQHLDDCHPRPKRKQHRPSRYQRQLIRLRNERPDVQQQNDGDDTGQFQDGPQQRNDSDNTAQFRDGPRQRNDSDNTAQLRGGPRQKNDSDNTAQLRDGPRQKNDSDDTAQFQDGPRQRNDSDNTAQFRDGPRQKNDSDDTAQFQDGPRQRNDSDNTAQLRDGPRQKNDSDDTAQFQDGPRQRNDSDNTAQFRDGPRQRNDSDNTAQLRDGPRQLYARRQRQPHRQNLRAPDQQGRNSTSDDLLATPPDDRLNVQTQRNVDRPLRVRTLSRRAQLAADLSDSDSDIEMDPVISHFRKRRNLAPMEFVKKKCRLEAIQLVACFTR